MNHDPSVNHHFGLLIDQLGRALVLSFFYPPSMGAPPPPSSWTFSARWMGAGGPLTDAFTPAAPIYNPDSSGGPVLFAGWGEIVPLIGGGFAAFRGHLPPGSGGIISPAGWYALYQSGEGRITSAPGWLQQYYGPLQLISSGAGYATLLRDPNTCARTIQLIAPSGRTCFTLRVQGSELCGWNEDVWPDGTLVLQNVCQLRWWPGLARLRQ
jgi:hypothetical protein